MCNIPKYHTPRVWIDKLIATVRKNKITSTCLLSILVKYYWLRPDPIKRKGINEDKIKTKNKKSVIFLLYFISLASRRSKSDY